MKDLLGYIGVFIIGVPILLAIFLNNVSPSNNSTNFAEPTGFTVKNFVRDDDYETERSYSDYGDYDCSDFSSQSEAQDFFESEGGPSYDYHNLDRDGDGIACESI